MASMIQSKHNAPSKISSSSSSQQQADMSEKTVTITGASTDSPVPPRRSSEIASEKEVLSEKDAPSCLATAFSEKKKWAILVSIFVVQLSMNFNAAIYGNAVPGMLKDFGISQSTAKLGQMIFLVAYAFGCELWAPWSEELGRKWVLQGSLFLVNVWQIPCALATNFWMVFGFRFLGGLSSAGGSVTLGIVADMWEPGQRQQHAVNFVVLSSVSGSVIAPIAGGFMTEYLAWQWVFWISLIFGAVAQGIHFFVPETRATVLLDNEAQRRRAQDPNSKIYGPNEIRGNFFQRIDVRHSLALMWRPYKFLLTEPIVAFVSLLSGFSDALIFSGLDSFPLVLDQWNLGHVAKGGSFGFLLFAYVLAWVFFYFTYRASDPNASAPERRLWLLCWLVPLEAIGLFGFGFCSLGPQSNVPFIAPMLFLIPIGIANYAIYQATIDYLIASYGEYSASATGGNGFARDLLAGVAALYTGPFYRVIKPGTKWQLPIPSLILSGIALVLAIPVYVFYKEGAWFRNRSPYAKALEEKRAEEKAEGPHTVEAQAPQEA